MSGQASAQGVIPDTSLAVDCHVRSAGVEDLEAIASAVSKLLTELGGTPPARAATEEAARAAIEDEPSDVLLVAEAAQALVGVLSASSQVAIHVPGRYLLIQDLWVDPAWRSRAIGAALLTELFARARERGVTRVEVGLPQERFAGLLETEAFYRRNGFVPLSTRMRLLLS